MSVAYFGHVNLDRVLSVGFILTRVQSRWSVLGRPLVAPQGILP